MQHLAVACRVKWNAMCAALGQHTTHIACQQHLSNRAGPTKRQEFSAVQVPAVASMAHSFPVLSLLMSLLVSPLLSCCCPCCYPCCLVLMLLVLPLLLRVAPAVAVSGEVQYALPGHKGSVNEVVFHPKEPIIGSCSNDRTIFLGELAHDN